MGLLPGYTASSAGWLVFGRDGALLAQRFDTSRLEFTGEPFSLSDKRTSIHESNGECPDRHCDEKFLHESWGGRVIALKRFAVASRFHPCSGSSPNRDRFGARVGPQGEHQGTYQQAAQIVPPLCLEIRTSMDSISFCVASLSRLWFLRARSHFNKSPTEMLISPSP